MKKTTPFWEKTFASMSSQQNSVVPLPILVIFSFNSHYLPFACPIPLISLLFFPDRRFSLPYSSPPPPLFHPSFCMFICCNSSRFIVETWRREPCNNIGWRRKRRRRRDCFFLEFLIFVPYSTFTGNQTADFSYFSILIHAN